MSAHNAVKAIVDLWQQTDQDREEDARPTLSGADFVQAVGDVLERGGWIDAYGTPGLEEQPCKCAEFPRWCGECFAQGKYQTIDGRNVRPPDCPHDPWWEHVCSHPSACPNCKSENIDFGESKYIDCGSKQWVTCDDCDAEWVVYWTEEEAGWSDLVVPETPPLNQNVDGRGLGSVV